MKNELFTVKPSLAQHYGRTVTKDMEFTEATENGEVKQTLKKCVLTTEICKDWITNGVESTLRSVMTEKLPEGTVLIWTECDGYVIPSVPVYKLSDLEREIAAMKEIYSDAAGTEKDAADA